MRVLDRFQPLALLLLRLSLGAVMASHGYQKVFHGLSQHAHLVASLGLPSWLGYVSAFTELLGGVALIAGFLTRWASLLVCIDLAVAIWKVHWHNGWMGNGGLEFPIALATIAFAMIFLGPGAISVDHALRGAAPSAKSK